MLTDVGVDTGDILLSDRLALTDDMYFPEVHDKLAVLGAGTLKRTLPLWEEGKITPQPQDGTKATKAVMLTKEHGRIDFNNSSTDITNLVRGLNPWPGTFVETETGNIKILKCRAADMHVAAGSQPGAQPDARPSAQPDAQLSTQPDARPGAQPGAILEVSRDGLTVKCGRGAVSITALQFEGGRAMDISECWHNLKTDLFINHR
jgi:methionyl-tRNA formyltransferase